jgi:hypothetical protein
MIVKLISIDSLITLFRVEKVRLDESSTPYKIYLICA